jgi:hypothetical protein
MHSPTTYPLHPVVHSHPEHHPDHSPSLFVNDWPAAGATRRRRSEQHVRQSVVSSRLQVAEVVRGRKRHGNKYVPWPHDQRNRGNPSQSHAPTCSTSPRPTASTPHPEAAAAESPRRSARGRASAHAQDTATRGTASTTASFPNLMIAAADLSGVEKRGPRIRDGGRCSSLLGETRRRMRRNGYWTSAISATTELGAQTAVDQTNESG